MKISGLVKEKVQKKNSCKEENKGGNGQKGEPRLQLLTRGWYRFYFQTGFLPVWGSKNRYKNRLTVNDETPLV